MFKTITRITLGTVLLAAALGLSACSDSDSPADPGQTMSASAPQLPALSTMKMDLSFFGSENVDASSIQMGSPSGEMMQANAGRLNFINAVVRVLYVQLVIYDALEAPIGAFAAAIHSIPQPQEDGSYLWTFIFVEDGIDYSIFLYGREVADFVEWRMEVSSNDPNLPLDHFKWFDGRAQNDDSAGYWQFYAPELGGAALASLSAAATEGRESVRMDWTNSPAGNSLDIVVQDERSEDVGDTIKIFDSATLGFVEVTDASTNDVANITWFGNGTGHITVPDYNNGEKACWDEYQRDTACE